MLVLKAEEHESEFLLQVPCLENHLGFMFGSS